METKPKITHWTYFVKNIATRYFNKVAKNNPHKEDWFGALFETEDVVKAAVLSGELRVSAEVFAPFMQPSLEAWNSGVIDLQRFCDWAQKNGMDTCPKEASELARWLELSVTVDESREVTNEKPWEIVRSGDPAAPQGWYTAARYFARQLVIEDSTLLQKKKTLADKVAKSLFDVGIKKRGDVKAYDGITILKAFTGLNFD